MARLNPTDSSSLARDVYRLTKLSSIQEAVKRLNDTYNNSFTFSEKNMLKGRTGGPGFIKVRTAFGFVLLGKGQLKGHAFILFRGTQLLADWLSNANLGVSNSVSGLSVHDGFNTAFKSMLPKLKQFIGSFDKEGVHTVHCIGHSLGGALATLCGDWIKVRTNKSTYVYTFGSPRAGLSNFSQTCTNRLGSGHIFRVYHKTDIVPMIPFWPFVHTPDTSRTEQDYYLPSPGVFPGGKYHDMDEYCKSISGKNWANLAGYKAEWKDDMGIVNWLKRTNPVTFSLTTLKWIEQSLIYVLKKCFQVAGFTLLSVVASSCTLMDQLAYVLKKGIDFSKGKGIASLVESFIRKMMEMLGMGAELASIDITRDFIRILFNLLQDKIYNYVQRALNATMAEGKAI